MPLQGPVNVNVDDPPYFESIQELDKWSSRPPPRLNGLLPYIPRSAPSEDSRRGKLLVCHDYKGGYKDTPDAFSYTFNFWQFTDIFVYFSHHRVTVPPPGWVNASHRQGTLMLGTLIFEGSAEDDCLRLVSGPTSLPGTQYVSPHYARVLAQLAYQRGFDGYLLNFECRLPGGLSQSRALTTWVAILDHELKRTIGEHAECVWYDSVIIDGSLRWQNRLNSLNLPYFPPSSSFFTNYSWPTSYPLLTVQYFLSLDPDEDPAKGLNDLYFGVDVWEEGSHGAGALGVR
ncbi:hypothetical protein NLI96_g12705 [Meripilus lineatus]|uniref:Cytosolic endo-beta-N-acetylglucosaminidase TIM barrel domain-containing protein n=1 Tax=Meripilus lineatus TaxID=2056292 RepID=A0AAD5URT2_9APHY|nr:hypothetical protein NLI96_g12705 [Physisporinus lineatus]